MKRTISLLLVFVMVLSMMACGQNNELPADSTPIALAHAEIAWDVSDIYHDQAAFEAELSQMQAQRNVLTALRGKLNTVDGVVSYYAGRDELYRLKERLGAYTTLIVAKDQSDNTAKELLGKVNNLSFENISDTAFALPEIFANADSFLDEVAKDERMKPYLAWFSLERMQSAHTLSEAEEQLLLPINQLRDGAYYLYGSLADSDLIFPKVTFPDGTERPADENNYAAIYNKTYSQEFRRTYYNALLQSYNQFRNTLAQNMQNYYSAVVKSAAYHKYDSALEAELAKGNTPIAVYDGVLLASDQAKPILSRYFALLKKNLNVSTLYNFDCNTDIVDDLGTVYDYADAQKLIKEALQPLGADYAAKLDEMFSSDAIDVYPVENKTTGGFAMSVPDVHPYILLNYTDDFGSVSTLSHELGHAVHMLYSKSQESVYDQNVTALASEVASTVNELLLSDYLIKNAKTEKERQYYAVQQMKKLFGTFFNQSFYARFQEAVAKEVENGGTLTADKLDALWLQATSDCFGPEYTATDAYAGGWARIPHFYTGFYVYQYAVGIAVACNIADRIQSGDPGAVEDYLAFLKAGNSADIVELLKLVGVDASNGDYIVALTARFDRLITEFERVK